MKKKLAGDVSGMIQLPKAGAGIFFIGIGGVSMSALAVICKGKGVPFRRVRPDSLRNHKASADKGN